MECTVVAALTMAALAVGYGLWLLSDVLLEWSGIGSWLPLIRLGTVVLGLTVADRGLTLLLRRVPLLRIPTQGDMP